MRLTIYDYALELWIKKQFYNDMQKNREKHKCFSLKWPKPESNRRHKDFQTSKVIATPCLWLPQINQDVSILQGTFDFFHDLLEVNSEQWQSSTTCNYGYITAILNCLIHFS